MIALWYGPRGHTGDGPWSVVRATRVRYAGLKTRAPSMRVPVIFRDTSFRLNLVRFRKDRLSFLTACSWSDGLQLALIPIQPLFERCLLPVIQGLDDRSGVPPPLYFLHFPPKNPKIQETLQKRWASRQGFCKATFYIIGACEEDIKDYPCCPLNKSNRCDFAKVCTHY